MATFWDRLEDPALHPYCYVVIDVDGAGNNPIYLSSVAFGVAAGEVFTCLDMQSNLGVSDSIVQRKSGVSSPRTLSVRVGPNESEALTYALAPVKAGTKGVCLAGKMCYVVVGLADAGGYPLSGTSHWENFPDPDTGGGLNGLPFTEAVIFAGPLESIAPNSDLCTWTLQIQSLEQMLESESIPESMAGYLAGGLNILAGPDAYTALTNCIRTTGMRLGFYFASGDSATVPNAYLDAAPYLAADQFNAGMLAEAVAAAINDHTSGVPAYPRVQENIWADWPTSDDVIKSGQKGTFRWEWAVRFEANVYVFPQTPNVRIAPADDGSMWGRMGYTSGQDHDILTDSQNSKLFTADQQPPVAYLSDKDLLVVVALPPSASPPASGVIQITDGERYELSKYTAISAPFASSQEWSLYELTFGDGRGLCGTDRLEVYVPISVAEDGSVASTAAGEIKICGGVIGESVFTCIGRVLTNGSGAGPFYDATYPTGYALKLSQYLVDCSRLEWLRDYGQLNGLLDNREMALVDSGNVRDLMGDLCGSLGITCQARTLADRTFRLTFDSVGYPIIAAHQSLDQDDLLAGEPVDLQHVVSNCCNRAEIEVPFTAGGGDDSAKFIVNEQTSQAQLGRTISESWKLPFLSYRKINMPAEVIGAHGMALIAPYSVPYEIVKLRVRRAAWAFHPGQQVQLTLPGIPGTQGGRGWTDEALLILGVSRIFGGRSTGAACELTCLHSPWLRCCYYSPSGEVKAYNAGTHTITLEANSFSDATQPYPFDESLPCRDILWFRNAAEVALEYDADDGARQQVAVASVTLATDEIELTGAPAVAPVAGDFVTLPAWDQRIVFELQFAALADALETLGAAGDPAFMWGGL